MRIWLAIIGIIAGILPRLEAAVIVHALPQALEISNSDFPVSLWYPIDVDRNGTVDFTFAASNASVGLRTERGNRLVILISPPPNLGGYVASLPVGSLLGPTTLDSSFRWESSDLLDGYVPPEALIASEIIQVFSTGYLSVGYATQFTGRSTIGIEFEAEDGIHYGYFDISPSPFIEPKITLHGWAWETQPGVPILAGQVPESSQVMLISMGVILLFTKRSRKNYS